MSLNRAIRCLLPLRFAALCGLVLTLLCCPHSALAEPPEIEQNYTAGKEALKESRFDDALVRFKAALKYSEGDEGRTWQMLLAVALTYKERNEPQHAIEYYRRFIQRTEGNLEMMPLKWKRRAELANADLAALEKQCEGTHGFVSVKTSPPGAVIIVDGVRGGADHDALSPFGLILPAGPRVIRIEVDGHAPQEKTVTVRPGGAHPLSFMMQPLPSIDASESADNPTSGAMAAPGPEVVTEDLPAAEAAPPLGALITFGVAGALGLSGVAMTVLASDRSNQLDTLGLEQEGITVTEGRETSDRWDTLSSEMETYQMTAAILYGVAGAAAIGGLVWMVVSEPEDVAHLPVLSVTPHPRGAMGQAIWSF